MLATASTSGCWDRLVGPTIRNGYAHPVAVTASYDSRPPMTIELKPGQTFWQRPPGVDVTELRVRSLDGEELQVLTRSDIEKTGLSKARDVLVVSDSGARVTLPK